MTTGNGKMTWIFWLVGALWFILTTTLVITVSSVIANDISSRDRDCVIEKDARYEKVELRKELLIEIKELNNSNKQILIALAELKRDINNKGR